MKVMGTVLALLLTGEVSAWNCKQIKHENGRVYIREIYDGNVQCEEGDWLWYGYRCSEWEWANPRDGWKTEPELKAIGYESID